jgi:NAD(P)-dependent dehydrogenase (short-subunit alcohol dehydrogenase family)
LPKPLTNTLPHCLLRVLAIDLAEYNIRVNAVAPGVSYTERTHELSTSNPQAIADLATRNPLQTYGTPLDYGAATAYLASDDAKYITGHILYVDGGLTAQLSLPGFPA